MGETKKEGLKRRNEKGKPRMGNLGGVFKCGEPRNIKQEGGTKRRGQEGGTKKG